MRNTYSHSKAAREKTQNLINLKNLPGYLFRADTVSCAPEKDINDFVLLATPRKTKDPRKKRPLLP